MIRSVVAIVLVAVGLSACGGGGGYAGTPLLGSGTVSSGSGSGGSGSSGGGTGASAGAAQGLYNGATSSGYDLTTVIIENGQFWAVYLRNGVAYGAVSGVSTSTASTFSGAGFDYSPPNATRLASNFSGIYTAHATISGTISSTAATFTGAYDTSFDTPASVNSIVGAWSGSIALAAGLQASSLTVDSLGNFAGHFGSCSYTGTTTPRANGKAVYDTTVTFATSGCPINGQTASGVTVVTNAGAELVMAVLLPDGSSGFFAAATR